MSSILPKYAGGLMLAACSAQAQIDAAVKASDQEATEMAAYLLRNDGLFVGSSSAVNCVGAAKAARWLGPGHTIVRPCLAAWASGTVT